MEKTRPVRQRGRQVAPRTVRIYKDGSARLSSDIYECGPHWPVWIPVGWDGGTIVLFAPLGGRLSVRRLLRIWYPSKFAKSPLISLTGVLTAMGVSLEKAVGEYIVRKKQDSFLLDLRGR